MTPDFDPDVYRLGSLCKRGHDWNGTGQSLRCIKGGPHCLICKRGVANFRARPPQTDLTHEPFDSSRFYIGTICIRGHAWGETKGTLRRKTTNKCDECNRITKREDYNRNREKIRVKAKEYRTENREKISQNRRVKFRENLDENRAKKRAQSARWKAKNPDGHKAVNAAYRKRNREALRKKHRVIAKRDAEKRKVYKKAYVEANREKVNATSRRRIESNPALKLHRNIGVLIRDHLPGRKGKGGKSWQSIVGYTRETLIAHLEKQFTPGMTWQNYGPFWHIDHIIPLSAFAVSGPSDPLIKKAWGLGNLRPLRRFDNLSKGNRLVLVSPSSGKAAT